ncbi:nicotinate-nucleotide--dimethylbenzimidazole phosphoribosyltransferase [Williamsia muralis]|uniref:nicotinate-nucleotide--dimethylbenzimidazole phosphoribosyltransferase n=1 Tax=Williamsia marianensis TaxID=85044 RepID=UPI000DE7589C|nr:nicotinate-nucleotide--dimethylbenzimidazole phosphoribosyltransferase [Williamsia marianensis]PVY33895.1 adenosylcobinamide kinase /nicotinate-nucleotide-dimethylbenzimidazole phosphoribosyltransferase /adenosylcobinamide-phosphate guanylyltransferase [Williamsia marianensis]
MRTLILGGIRSGKSAFGEGLLPATGVRYIATAADPATGDPQWSQRIAAHRSRRPAGWQTVESADVAGRLRSDPDVATLVDDLGGWVSRQIDDVGGWDDDNFDLSDKIAEFVSAIADFTGDLVIISPEVGLSLVAPTPAGRLFQDQLGLLNNAVAATCDRTVLVVAGKVLEISDPQPAAINAVGAAPVPVEGSKADDIEATSATPQTEGSDDSGQHAGLGAATEFELPEQFDFIAAPDRDAAIAARARQGELTKPAGSLGRLEEIAVWVASCQGVCPPSPFGQPTVVVFAGDHGVARAGVSAYPPEVTAQMVANFTAGGAAVNVLARLHGAKVRVEDLAVDAETPEAISRFKVRRSSGDLTVEDALTTEQTRAALAAGRAIADQEIDSGADLLIAGEMGIGNTTPATILVGLLTDNEPVVVVGRGTGIDDNGWIRKTAAVRDGMRRARPHGRVPLELLRTVAGAEITAMAGFLAQAALRRTPVILDGLVVTAAALVANDMAPGAREWWLAGHRSAEPAHSLALKQLDLEPLLDLSMRLGEGSGALTALPVVQSAVATLASMATFAEAQVTGAPEPTRAGR